MLGLDKVFFSKKDYFTIGVDSFDEIEINKANSQNGFWYFKNKKTNNIIKKFILKNSKQTRKSCEIKLIKKDSDNCFTPRFDFRIYDKTKNTDMEYKRSEIKENFIKAKIDLGDCHDKFMELLNFIFSLDEINFNHTKYSVISGGEVGEIKKILSNGSITNEDLVNIGYRKRQLEIFEEMLNNCENINEKDWQQFFENNQWIFGYGLDYRFNTILQREASVSDSNIDGTKTVISDFLMADNNFTTFVEIKKPNTPLFIGGRNRSRAWKLSSDLNDAVSQILEQKASGELKLQTETNYNNGQVVGQKPYDSKVILIIGSWGQLEGLSDQEKDIKKKTFELFRRNSRNVEILTYDELYERASFIVNNNSTKEIS